MNFKLTTLKTIVLVIAGLITGFYFSKVEYIGGSGPPYVFGVSSVIGSIIGFVVVYLVWSLIQKKKK